ncbi:hypothetical protein DFH09DRAFT_1073164 [Mycena vulgaris]|nr:hypothetical protein DFH09DRAFT_1073164 [Mycena vulgaris]
MKTFTLSSYEQLTWRVPRRALRLNPPLPTVKGKLSDKEKHASHAEAQRRFRERNLDATCAQARQRMQRLCAQPRSPEEVQQALKKRREADTTDNELKFVAKHGHDNFMDYYFPKYTELGQKYLPRLRFEDGPAAAKKTMKPTMKEWVRPNSWARSNLEGAWWMPECEVFYQKRLSHFAGNIFLPTNPAKWRHNLKFRSEQKQAKEIWVQSECVVASIVQQMIEMGLLQDV